MLEFIQVGTNLIEIHSIDNRIGHIGNIFVDKKRVHLFERYMLSFDEFSQLQEFLTK